MIDLGRLDILTLLIFTPLVGALIMALAAPAVRLFGVEVDSRREAGWMRAGAKSTNTWKPLPTGVRMWLMSLKG